MEERKTINFWISAFCGLTWGEAVVMTSEEFHKFWDKKFPPHKEVYVEDEDILYLESYTCWSSHHYGGTCNCINHPHKSWDKYKLTDNVRGDKGVEAVRIGSVGP